MFFDSVIDALDFNVMEPGNPMTLGFIEENYNSKFVDGYSTNPFYDDDNNDEFEYDSFFTDDKNDNDNDDWMC